MTVKPCGPLAEYTPLRSGNHCVGCPTAARRGFSSGRSPFGAIPTRKVSADLSRDAFGLIGLTILKLCLEALDQLAVAAAVKDLADQRAARVSGARRRNRAPVRPDARCAAASALSIPDRLGAMSDSTRSTRRPASACSSSASTDGLAEIALDELDPLDRLEIEQIERDDGAVELPAAAPPPPASVGANRRRTYWLQAPGVAPRSTTSWPGLISPSSSSICFSL